MVVQGLEHESAGEAICWEAVSLHFEQQTSQQKTAAIVYIAEHAVGFHRPIKPSIVQAPFFLVKG